MGTETARTRDAEPRHGVALPNLGLDLLVAALVLVTATATLGTVPAGDVELGPIWLLAVFVPLFVIGEAVNIRLEVRRQAYSFTMSEIPLVVSLFFLPPLAILVVRLIGAAIIQMHRRHSPRKAAVNLASFTAETAVAVYVFQLFEQNDPGSSAAWIAVYSAIGAADLLGVIAVSTAITIVQGLPSPRQMLLFCASTLLTALLNGAVGLLVLIVIGVNGLAVLLLSMVAGTLVVGYRAYTDFMQQHKNLGELYEFTKAVSTSRQDGSLADELLTRTRKLLSAESATLWLPAHGRHPEIALVAQMDTPGLVDVDVVDDSVRNRVVETGRTIHLGPKGESGDLELLAAMRARRVKDLIVVPLRSGAAIIGCLEVADRLSDLSTFGVNDVRLLETLAAHAAVAVENSRLVDRLRHDAYHDGLTGLPNRRRLLNAITAAINVQTAPGEVVALLQFDVDSLRDVNETLGYVAGDRLLAEVGRRLQAEAPKGALVARTGGDEFAVLVRAQGAEGASATAVALQYSLIEPFELENFTVDVGAAVGIALYPDHASDAETMMQRVDVATYAAKTNPRSVQLYRPAMESRTVHRLGLVAELRRAIEDGSLTVHYQPKVALATRELLGVECLVRWEHAEQGLVSPDDFIPVAEQTGLVGALTSRVLRTALEQCKAWNDAGRPIGVSVNLSSRSLLDPEFPDELQSLLDEIGLPPPLLTLEITESGMVGDADRPLPTLRRLHSMGVRLAVDDFGTGYSSLAYLRRLPVHEVKIDKSFVLGMATDSGDLAIVRAIVDLGRHLGLSVVAEGVESEMTLALLENMGCDVAQGFLFSRPLPHERIEAWMAARTELTPGPPDGDQRLRVVTG